MLKMHHFGIGKLVFALSVCNYGFYTTIHHSVVIWKSVKLPWLPL